MEPKVVWRWDRNPDRKTPARTWQLSETEQGHLKKAIRTLRLYMGRRRFAEAAGISLKAAKHSTETKRSVSAGLAVRVARAAGAKVEDILAGRLLCPTCGQLRTMGQPKG